MTQYATGFTALTQRCWSYGLLRTLAGDQSYELSDSHVDPLLHRVADAMAFGDHDPGESVVVPGFDLSLTNPAGQIFAGAILRFDDKALAVDSDAGDVASVLRASAGATFDAVVAEGCREGASNARLESCASLLGAGAGAGQSDTSRHGPT